MARWASQGRLVAMVLLSACVAAPEAAPAFDVAFDGLMLSDLAGPLHLRVFPKGALRCDAATGQVLDATGTRALAGLPGGAVTPAVRCGARWATESARFGTASPVDTCLTGSAPTTVAINDPGAYIVLVHGQGDVRLPDGTTRSDILGAGCAEVGVAAGQQQSATVVVREQRPAGNCGDGTLDFDESCDLGAANAEDGACTRRCQTPVRFANSSSEGLQRHPAVVWPMGRRLVVAWHVENVSSEDVKARYFAADGTPEMTFGALRNEVVLGGGPSTQTSPALTVVTGSTAGAFAGAWETLQQTPGTIAVQVFNDDPPLGTGSLSAGGARRRSPSVAVGGNQVMTAWHEEGNVHFAGYGLMRPVTTGSAPSAVGTSGATDPRVVALADATFALVWAASGDLFALRLSAAGAAMGTPVRVSPNAAVQDQPTAAALPEGGLVVAWRDATRDAADNDGTSIRWVRLDASLTAMGAATVVNTTTAGDQSRPALVVAPGSPSTMLIAWEDTATGTIRGRLRRADDRDVFARLGGTASDFAVSSEGPGQHRPAVAFGGPAGDRFVVAWEAGEGVGAGIALRDFPR